MFVYMQVAEFVRKHGDAGVGRSDVARHFGVTKQTALEHLEKCVRYGTVAKVYTWVSHSAHGWVYYPVVDTPFWNLGNPSTALSAQPNKTHQERLNSDEMSPAHDECI
jgi:hypothetical protein